MERNNKMETTDKNLSFWQLNKASIKRAVWNIVKLAWEVAWCAFVIQYLWNATKIHNITFHQAFCLALTVFYITMTVKKFLSITVENEGKE